MLLRVVSPPALPPRQCMYTDHGDGCAAARVCWAWGCALRKRGRVCRYIVCVRARAPRRVACVCACVVRVVCRGPCPVPTPDAYSLWSLGAWLCVVDRIAHLDVSIVRRFTTGDTEKRDTCAVRNATPIRSPSAGPGGWRRRGGGRGAGAGACVRLFNLLICRCRPIY